MLEPLALTCPYCGEGFESLCDESEAAFGAGVFEAIEDCPVLPTHYGAPYARRLGAARLFGSAPG